MQHVPSVQSDHTYNKWRFPLFAIALLVLLSVALVFITSVPAAFAPMATSAETYQNPELWAFDRYEYGAVPSSSQVGAVNEAPAAAVAESSSQPALAANPELSAFSKWQNAAAPDAEARFLATNPEVGQFHRWQALK